MGVVKFKKLIKNLQFLIHCEVRVKDKYMAVDAVISNVKILIDSLLQANILGLVGWLGCWLGFVLHCNLQFGGCFGWRGRKRACGTATCHSELFCAAIDTKYLTRVKFTWGAVETVNNGRLL